LTRGGRQRLPRDPASKIPEGPPPGLAVHHPRSLQTQGCGAIEGDGRRDQGAALGVMESEGRGRMGRGAPPRSGGRGVSGGLRGERRTPPETNRAHAARGPPRPPAAPCPPALPPTEAPPPPLLCLCLRPESVEPHRPPLCLPSVTLDRPTLCVWGRSRVTDGKRRGGAPPCLAFPIPREPCPPQRAATPPGSGPQLRGGGGGGTSSCCNHEVPGRRAASPDRVGSPAPRRPKPAPLTMTACSRGPLTPSGTPMALKQLPPKLRRASTPAGAPLPPAVLRFWLGASLSPAGGLGAWAPLHELRREPAPSLDPDPAFPND
jgi:hypothetical protein